MMKFLVHVPLSYFQLWLLMPTSQYLFRLFYVNMKRILFCILWYFSQENPTWHIAGMFRTSSAHAWMMWVYISAIVLHQSDINKDIKLT